MARVNCPLCGRPVPEPLPRGSLLPIVHARGDGCRFWIVVAPREDVRHRVVVLEEGQTFEGTAQSIVPEYRRLLRRDVLLRMAEEQEAEAGEEQESWQAFG